MAYGFADIAEVIYRLAKKEAEVEKLQSQLIDIIEVEVLKLFRPHDGVSMVWLYTSEIVGDNKWPHDIVRRVLRKNGFMNRLLSTGEVWAVERTNCTETP